MGFVVIFFIIAIIASRDLVKQSIIAFQISQIAHYEQAIKKEVDFGEGKEHVFNTAADWKNWYNTVHANISINFQILVAILAVFFPAIVLWKSGKLYTSLYIIITVLVLWRYLHTAQLLKGAMMG